MGPTPEQVQLIRDYEPALFFVGGVPGSPGGERFFPSDAKFMQLGFGGVFLLINYLLYLSQASVVSL